MCFALQGGGGCVVFRLVNAGRKERVVIGMSGGVDSSSAAALLQEQGYEVVGITLKLWPQDCISRAEDKCCGPQAVMDARNVSHRLGIPFYLVDEAADFQKEVIEYFAAEYRAGRTPNPCAMCNEKVKFGALIRRARRLGAEKIATGHYARIERSANGGRMLLRRGKDASKDQSYFLFSLKQEQLARTLMPLGGLAKSESREVARRSDLRTADKEESMEICFVPDNDYKAFLTKAKMVKARKGEIVDLAGNVLGHHEGIEFYTIGQRRGLGVSSPEPLYVLRLDPASNRVVVGAASELEQRDFVIERCNWIPFEKPSKRIRALAQIRYNHRGVSAVVVPNANGRATVRLERPQRAITPGQACVFYQDDLVLGGGWIARESLETAKQRLMPQANANHPPPERFPQ